MAGDIIRRLVGRTIAQQLAPAVERATALFQYALTTRAGCECIGHVLHSETDASPDSTVFSIDGIGAFDLVSREAMLRGLLSAEGGEAVLPFVRQFYGAPSMYLWQDDSGVTHEIHQGEGSEQGDAPMPALFSLGQHPALVAVQRQLGPNERLLAFLDDIYARCSPDRVIPVFNLLRRELWCHSRIQIHLGKTQLCNQGGVELAGLEALTADARMSDPQAIVWRGDRSFPLEDQRLLVLGTPLGSPQFVKKELEKISTKHRSLMEKIPLFADLQCAWLLLVFCAAPRPNNVLRMLHPSATHEFATPHDASVKRCFELLLHNPVSDDAWSIATLPLIMGGLGLRSACRRRHVSYGASWADVLHMIRLRHTLVAESMLAGLASNHPGYHLQGAATAWSGLEGMGFRTPEWGALARGVASRRFPS